MGSKRCLQHDRHSGARRAVGLRKQGIATHVVPAVVCVQPWNLGCYLHHSTDASHQRIALSPIKAWSGLVGTYYARRYSIYADLLLQSGGKTVSKSAYATAVMKWACEFAHDTESNEFPSAPVGDVVAIAEELWSKYAPQG